MDYVLVEFDDNSMAVLQSTVAIHNFNICDPPKLNDALIVYYSKPGTSKPRPYTATVIEFGDQQELRNKLMAMTKDDVDETGDSVKLLGRGQREKIRKQLSSDDESAEGSKDDNAVAASNRKKARGAATSGAAAMKTLMENVKKNLPGSSTGSSTVSREAQVKPVSTHVSGAAEQARDRPSTVEHCTNCNQMIIDNEILARENRTLKGHVAACDALPTVLIELKDELAALRGQKDKSVPGSSSAGTPLCRQADRAQSASAVRESPSSALSVVRLKTVPSTVGTVNLHDSAPIITPNDKATANSFNSFEIVLQNVDKSHGTSKMVNELMQGLFTDEYMATHSIAGMGNNKDAMDPTVLAKIVASVKDVTNASKGEIHKCIRQKLTNARSGFVKKLQIPLRMLQSANCTEKQQSVYKTQHDSTLDEDGQNSEKD